MTASFDGKTADLYCVKSRLFDDVRGQRVMGDRQQ